MGEVRPPPYVICHLCGRKYGTKSIRIHEPQCFKKWNAENRKLPKHLRRQIPQKPDYELLRSGNCDAEMIDQLNEMSFKSSQAQLVPCEHCGRTFYPEKLPVHQRSCTADKPARRPVHCKSSPKQKSTFKTNSLNKNELDYDQEKENIKHANNDHLILCAICFKQIPKKKIQSHLVCCNEEKIKSIKLVGVEENKDIPNDRSSRPRTRTIRRGSQLNSNGLENHGKDGTCNIIKPNASYDVEVPSVTNELTEFSICEYCNRKFSKERVMQHQKICSKIKKKERKIFDSSKQRLQEAENMMFKKNKSKEQHTAPKSNWRQKHEEFIQAIKSAKQVTNHMAKGGKASDIPPPPPSLNPDYVYCRYCDRRFNPEVAERHIPKCAKIINRPSPPKQKALEIHKNSIAKEKELRRNNTFQMRRASNDKQRKTPSKFTKSGNMLDHNSAAVSHHEQKGIKSMSNSLGYVSPRLDSRYNSFENKNSVIRKNSRDSSMTASGEYKALYNSKDHSRKRNSPTASKRNKPMYSYNSPKLDSSAKPSKGFLF